MSSMVRSPIFDSLVEYISNQKCIVSVVTKDPIKEADLYYYFRPHLENELLSPSVVTVHHDLGEKHPSLDFNLFIKRYVEADVVICLNNGQKKLLASFGIHHTKVIPHGYNSDLFNQKADRVESRESEGRYTLGFLSHYYPRLVKGEELLLDIARKLSIDDFKFILCGRRRGLLARDLRKIGFDVEVYENLPYRFYKDIYRKIDSLIITSEYEGGPASFPESIASGTPVFSTDVGMIADCKYGNMLEVLTRDPKKDAELIMRRKEEWSNKDIIASRCLITFDQVSYLYKEIFEGIIGNATRKISFYNFLYIKVASIIYRVKTRSIKRRLIDVVRALIDVIKLKSGLM